MKRILALLVVVLGSASLAFAQPATMPAVRQPLKVLIIPFRQVGNTTGHEWVASAIQENLMTEAAGNLSIQALGLGQPLNGSGPEAMEAGKNMGATLVVFGTYEISDSQLRVNGQIEDVNYGRTLGTLKATGAITDLFKIEDTLSSQLGSALPQPPAPANEPMVTYGPDQSSTPVPYYTANPQVVTTPPPTYVYSYPPYSDYSYPYAYPYDYYPYASFPVIVYGGWGRGWYGHPWVHGYVGPGFHGGIGFGVHGGYAGGGRGGFGGGHGR
jgi:TolB-like protein